MTIHKSGSQTSFIFTLEKQNELRENKYFWDGDGNGVHNTMLHEKKFDKTRKKTKNKTKKMRSGNLGLVQHFLCFQLKTQ